MRCSILPLPCCGTYTSAEYRKASDRWDIVSKVSAVAGILALASSFAFSSSKVGRALPAIGVSSLAFAVTAWALSDSLRNYADVA